MKNLFSISSLLILLLTTMGSLADQPSDSTLFKTSGDPQLRSSAVMITDLDGKLIYGKNTDEIRPIASITKLMTAIVVIDAGLDMQQKITITKDDRDLIRLTGSRLEYGAVLTREELLRLAIMSSENRAAAALGRSYPGGTAALVTAMNKKAQQLGMQDSRFADAAGLQSGNVSTAKDLSILVATASTYPLIKDASTTKSMTVKPYKKRGPLQYVNTNRLLKNSNWQIGLSKTGYIHEAGRCLVMQATIQGKAVSIVLLNSFGKLTPFGDSNRLMRWLTANS